LKRPLQNCDKGLMMPFLRWTFADVLDDFVIRRLMKASNFVLKTRMQNINAHVEVGLAIITSWRIL
jgi:hypothetical protein